MSDVPPDGAKIDKDWSFSSLPEKTQILLLMQHNTILVRTLENKKPDGLLNKIIVQLEFKLARYKKFLKEKGLFDEFNEQLEIDLEEFENYKY